VVIVEIVVLTVVITVLLGLAGAFMARTITSTNLARLQGVGTLVTGKRGRPPAWFTSLVRGEQPDSRDDE
jgi:hypothetical protein